MTMSSESDETTKPNSGVDSSSVDDAIDGNVGGNGPLKKGPWTSAEDAILVEYVTKHGEGNWNAVQKFSGLARCGKSCRLRWANHLRPDLKKGAFMPEEERRIIELHAKMGNKWARMAAELPGRTDNEIKNYWNTRIKRRQRAGLPIYPPDICLQSLNENLQSDSMNNLSSGNVHHPDLMPINNFEIPAVEFKNLELNQLNHNIYSPALPEFPAGSLLDIPASSLAQGLNSPYHNKSLLPTVHSSKRLRGSEPFFQTFNTPVSNAFHGGNQYQSDGSMQIGKSSIYSAYPNPATEHARSSGLTIGSHAVTNGNPSSEPDWAMKLELPSLQTQMGSWGSPSPSSPLPFFESVDIISQSPPNEHMQSSNLSTQNSGLLDAVLYESETMKNSKSSGVQQTPHFSSVAVNTMDDSAHVLHETEWRAYEEQLSPLGNSSSSVFSESTPVSGNSLDEPFSSRTLPVKEEAIHGGLVPYGNEVEPRNQIFFSRPDFLLDSSCFGPVKHPTKEHSLLKDSIGTLHGDDLNRVCKKVDAGATPSAQDRDPNPDPDPGAWSAMPNVQ